MARTWHTPAERRSGPSWWARTWWSEHWANPSFSGSLIGIASVLLVMAAGLYIGAEALHLDLGHLGFDSLLGR